MNSPRDLQLTDDGTWEPYDVGASDLKSQGWEPFSTIGGEGVSLNLHILRRNHNGRSEYLMRISSREKMSEYMKVRDLPTLMDLLARWAPAVQAASIADIVTDLHQPSIEDDGIVETVAARAAWGKGELFPKFDGSRKRLEADLRAQAAQQRQERRTSEK